MTGRDKIRTEYETALRKKQELSEKLREMEKTDPDNFHRIWMTRDQIAYWEGMSEGLKLALDELER